MFPQGGDPRSGKDPRCVHNKWYQSYGQNIFSDSHNKWYQSCGQSFSWKIGAFTVQIGSGKVEISKMKS